MDNSGLSAKDDSFHETNSNKKDGDIWIRYIKLEYDKIVKNFNVKKSKEIK